MGDIDLGTDPAAILTTFKGIDKLPGTMLDIELPTTTIRDALHRAADLRLVGLVADTLDLQLDTGLDPAIVGPTVPGTVFVDGGLIDGGVVDGGVVDGGVIDGGLIDGGLIDGGLIDGGIVPLAERIRIRRAAMEEGDR